MKSNSPRTGGLRGRFFIAFFSISALTMLGAAATFFAFAQVSTVLNEVTRQRLPAMLTALELSREAERLATLAPRLIADESVNEQLQTDRLVRLQIAKLNVLFTKVKESDVDVNAVAAIERAVRDIRQNLAKMQLFREVWRDPSEEGAFDKDITLFPRGKLVPPSRSDLLSKGQSMIQDNFAAAARLTKAVDQLIADERTAISRAEGAVSDTRQRSSVALAMILVLSVMGSILIPWLYVGRSIVRRLKALSTSMLAIADGDLKSPLPSDIGTDEVGHMANALHIFRDKLEENARLNRLKSFLAPQVAALIVSSGDEGVLRSHRRDVAVLFCDLRGFTAFAETAEPEDIMGFLGEYRETLVELVEKHHGTLERFTGDGLIVLFNDPLPIPDPCLEAARLAIAMREAIGQTIQTSRRLQWQLGFGMGIAYGYATLGQIGAKTRVEYTAIGSVVNLAARLCEKAQDKQILIDGKVHRAIADHISTEELGDFTPKGRSHPIKVFNIRTDSYEST